MTRANARALAWVLAAAAALAGCGTGAIRGKRSGDALRLAPLLAPSEQVLGLVPPSFEPPPAEAEQDPTQIMVEAYFIEGEPARLKELGLSLRGQMVTLSVDEAAGILRQIFPTRRQPRGRWDFPPGTPLGRRLWESGYRCGAGPDPRAGLAIGPRMTFFTGQRAVLPVCTSHPYVLEYQLAPETPAGGKRDLISCIAHLNLGYLLDLQASAEGEAVVFTRIAPATARLLGMRDCSARVRIGSREERVVWQEPVVLMGRADVPTPCRVRLEPDQVLAVSLRYTAEGGSGSTRALAVGGKVRERYTKSRETGAGDRQTVVLLTALVIRLEPEIEDRAPVPKLE